jgi:hypothetical protein
MACVVGLPRAAGILLPSSVGRCHLIHEGRWGSDVFVAADGSEPDEPTYLGQSHNLGFPFWFVWNVTTGCLLAFRRQVQALPQRPRIDSPMPVIDLHVVDD